MTVTPSKRNCLLVDFGNLRVIRVTINTINTPEPLTEDTMQDFQIAHPGQPYVAANIYAPPLRGPSGIVFVTDSHEVTQCVGAVMSVGLMLASNEKLWWG